MSNRRNAVLGGLAAACSLFILLIAAAHLQALAALVVAIVGGGAVLAALSRRPSVETPPAPAIVAAPASPPVQFQAQPITGIRLLSALADYKFAFAANVLWLPPVDGGSGTAEIAVNEIIRRAHEVTERRDPSEATLIASDLTMALGVIQSDPSGRVQVKAESIHLQLPPEDQQRLEEFARLRKEEGLWEYQRRYQVNKRRYLRTDVLKDSGSAVVWWLAKHEDDPRQVAESIDVLTRLAGAANCVNGTEFTPSAAPVAPQTPVERFNAFLDSLDPPLGDDVRLLLTDQVARFVDRYDQKAADEMCRRHSEPDGSDDYWDYPGETEGALPE